MLFGIRILEDCPKSLNVLIRIKDMAIAGQKNLTAFPSSFRDHHGVPNFLMGDEFLHADLEADFGQNAHLQGREIHGRVASGEEFGEGSLGKLALQGSLPMFIDPSELLKDGLSNDELSMGQTLSKCLQGIKNSRILILLIKENVGVNGNEQQLFSHLLDCGRSGA